MSHAYKIAKNDPDVTPGGDLLGLLAERGLYLPSACGGNGSCGSCACRVLSPRIEHKLKEIPYLDPERRAEGYHLACQVRIDGDLEVELPDRVAAAVRLPALAAGIEAAGEGALWLELETDAALAHVPGQYCVLELPAADGAMVRRAYSIAHARADGRGLGFLIALRAGGRFSRLAANLAPGAGLTLVGPLGDFAGFDDGPELWLASGSGAAPFLRLAEERALAAPDRPVVAIIEGSGDAGRYARARLERLGAAAPGFELRAGDAPLPVQLAAWIADRKLPEGWSALVCAAPPKREACANLLARAGLPPARLRSDLFF